MGWPGRLLVEGYRRLLTHPRYGIWVVLASFAYIISPIDLSPDLLPLLGQIDDVAIIVLMVSALTQWMSQRLSANDPSSRSAANSGERDGREGRDETAVNATIDVDAIAVDPD
jgi:uncharacterized membrane protein YkvA (DUF1232 family)